MERNGRLFCHTSGPLRLSVTRIGLDRKPSRPDNARLRMHGEALRLNAARAAAWRPVSMAADSQPYERGGRSHAPRLSGPGPFRRFMLASMASISYPGTQAEQLLLAPQELRTADPSFATELYNGHFGLGRQTGRGRRRVAVRDRAAVGRLGARAVRLRLAQASARRRLRAVARAGQGAGAGFHHAQALDPSAGVAAGDRRPPGDLVAVELGAGARTRASRKPMRISSRR